VAAPPELGTQWISFRASPDPAQPRRRGRRAAQDGLPLDELSRNVDIVAELYRLSEGDPLLVDCMWATCGKGRSRYPPPA